MHIGILAADLSHRHGWAHHNLSLLQALQRLGVQLTVITARNSPDIADIPAAALLPTTNPLEKSLLLKSLLTVPRIRQQIRTCDIIHALIEPYAVAGAVVAGRRPLLVTAHGSYVTLLPRRRWPVGAAYRWALKHARLLCVSQYTAQVARAALGAADTVVIPNGIDPARFITLPRQPDSAAPVVLAVGAIKPRKGTLQLVRALAVVRQQLLDVQGVIIGSTTAAPDYVRQVQAEIESLGLAGQVHLLGHVSEAELLDWYSRASVFALPSMNSGGRFEGFGLAYIEASAAGLPVIGTRDCGAADAIREGETGLLVAQSTVTTDLPSAIMTLLTDTPLANSMGSAGRAFAQQQTWDRAAQAVVAEYARALST